MRASSGRSSRDGRRVGVKRVTTSRRHQSRHLRMVNVMQKTSTSVRSQKNYGSFSSCTPSCCAPPVPRGCPHEKGMRERFFLQCSILVESCIHTAAPGGKTTSQKTCNCSADTTTSRTAIFPCCTSAHTRVIDAASMPHWWSNAARSASSGHACGSRSLPCGLFEA